MDYFLQGFEKLNPWLICLYFLFLRGCFCADPRGCFCADPPYGLCSSNTNNYSDNSPFQKNLNNLLQNLRSNALDSKFYNTSVGTNGADKVYGLFMCFNYVSQETCRDYIATASQEVLRSLCPSSKEAVVWDEHCQLRYSNNDFFGELDVSSSMPQQNTQNISSQPEQFRATVDKTLRNLTHVAAYESEDMYAFGEVPFMDKTVYAIEQCTRDLSPDECRNCLGNSTQEILNLFYFSIGARLYSRSCYLRYELYAFYKGESEASPATKNGEDSGRKIWKVALITAASACLVITVFGYLAYHHAFIKRNKKGQESHKNINRLNGSKDEEYPFVDLSSILAATSYFSESNKLGQGSFGPVYKGVLKEGREVAVKRLSFCSEQGSDEFTNEVLLIMKLQHKNLVKLLGFCVDGDEKLLVYEYMQNKSLDVILSDSKMRAKLDWSTRIDIINGIARGILYLHEDSRLRIIHRDLKASNILLDSDMNPKISDFGIARIFAGSEGEANTSTIVGTYGYMAPEYAMEGIYSIKSDVFSYGVLLIEIIAGKSNAGCYQIKHAPSLLAYAWYLWREGQMLELIDPLIANSCNTDEFLRYLHIGLLCVQEDAYDRPTMSSVVVMLKGESMPLGQPKRPAFFTGRLSERHISIVDDSFSVNSFTVSNVTPR